MIEFAAAFYFAQILAVPVGYLVSLMTNFLDDAMDFGGYFWEWRYYLAKSYSVKVGMSELLENTLKETLKADYEVQSNSMRQIYADIASKNLAFNRWICPMCMGVFFSMIINVVAVIVMLVVAFEPVVIIFFVFSMPLFTYRFVK